MPWVISKALLHVFAVASFEFLCYTALLKGSLWLFHLAASCVCHYYVPFPLRFRFKNGLGFIFSPQQCSVNSSEYAWNCVLVELCHITPESISSKHRREKTHIIRMRNKLCPLSLTYSRILFKRGHTYLFKRMHSCG